MKRQIVENGLIDFCDILLPKKDTPRERKKKEVLNTIEAVLAAHPPAMPYELDKLAVFGSRSLHGEMVLALIGKYLAECRAKIIVTAFEPVGVCQTARNFCHENKTPLEVHFLNIAKYARGAHEHRSDEVILSADATLYIHDGKSRGTYNEILRSIKFKKPFFYERIYLDAGEGVFCDVI